MKNLIGRQKCYRKYFWEEETKDCLCSFMDTGPPSELLYPLICSACIQSKIEEAMVITKSFNRTKRDSASDVESITVRGQIMSSISEINSSILRIKKIYGK